MEISSCTNIFSGLVRKAIQLSKLRVSARRAGLLPMRYSRPSILRSSRTPNYSEITPMRTLAFTLLTIAFSAAAPAAPDDPQPKPAAPAKVLPPKPIDWQDDPVCRMVFHAVLEGLYEDGVSDAVVDAIVPREAKSGDDPVKKSFVAKCPLCHPVYEAFAAYQKRPAFSGDSAKRNTLGKGLDAAVVKDLTGADLQKRLKALAPLVQKWVAVRLASMRLTKKETLDWQAQLSERSEQGKSMLYELMHKDPHYKDWSGYWGCAACNGTTDACRAMKPAQQK